MAVNILLLLIGMLVPDQHEADFLNLYVFFGKIACGKSFLAEKWAGHNDCPYLNSDVIRKELVGIKSNSRQKEALNAGIYSPEHSRKTYDELLRRAKDVIAVGQDCAIDASFMSPAERQRVVGLFSKSSIIWFILCECSEDVVKQRLQIRSLDENAVSDGRWEIYKQQTERFKAPDDIDPRYLIRIDTNKDIGLLVTELGSYIN